MLKLRNIKDNDLEMIMNWRMKPEVTKYMYTDPKLTIEDQKKWFKKISEDKHKKYWIINFENTDIGLISIDNIDYINKNASWAYYIADTSFRGRGLARKLEYNIYNYAFEELNLNKLWCEVLSFNEIVVKIHEKYGSKIEGILREHIFKNNEFHDVVRMSILKKEWDAMKQNIQYEIAEIE